jgi:hypothetical protein
MQNLLQKKGVPENTKQFEAWIQKKIKQQEQFKTFRTAGVPTLKIPVVIHVVFKDKPGGIPEAVGEGSNLSDAQILSQIDVLNKDFNRLNTDANQTPPDFLPVAGSMNIEFVLAKQTPDGLTTNGIVRVNGHDDGWSQSEDAQLKALSRWPSEDYLNIWVTKISGVFIGYSQFPVSDLAGLEPYQNGLAETDGVVIDYRCFGVDSEDGFYNLGRTTTHEVGHFFGLRHIWGDASGCATDYVSDTPPQASATTDDCSTLTHPKADACSNAKMYQNYMDYSDDACLNLFTQGQITRMTTILQDSDVPRRSSLLTSHGLVNPDCSGNPSVDLAIRSIIQPGPVTCDDNPSLLLSVENVSCPLVTSVKIEYEINNGATQSVTISDLSIFANDGGTTIDARALDLVEGENTISMRVVSVNNLPDNDPSNSDTTITIVVNTASDIIPLLKNFDDNHIDSWTVANPRTEILWNIDAQNRARFPVQSTVAGEESWLVSPVLDFRGHSEASLFFQPTYTWNTSDNDRLRVLASTDCGNSYFALGFNRSGNSLQQASGKQHLSLNSLAGHENVRIAFVATSAEGNNIYIDDIEFFVSDDPFPIDPEPKLYTIYWNGNGGVDITFNLPERANVNLTVVDMMGQEAFRAELPDMLNQTIPIGTGNIPAGIYIIRLQIGKKYYTTKVYISQ